MERGFTGIGRGSQCTLLGKEGHDVPLCDALSSWDFFLAEARCPFLLLSAGARAMHRGSFAAAARSPAARGAERDRPRTSLRALGVVFVGFGVGNLLGSSIAQKAGGAFQVMYGVFLYAAATHAIAREDVPETALDQW
eukprot:gene17189-biopygen10224